VLADECAVLANACAYDLDKGGLALASGFRSSDSELSGLVHGLSVFWLFVLYDSGSNGESPKHALSMADCPARQSSHAINLPRATTAPAACAASNPAGTLRWYGYTR
jgi:hypothetical protein